jgi:hypothetical protein
VTAEIHTITPGERYPAAGALMEIGRPCLPAVVKVVAQNASDSLESRNALEIVRVLFRYDLAGGVDYLNEAAEKASSPEAAKRLRKAAESLRETER